MRPSEFQYRFSLNVWAGFIRNHVVGPIFLPRLNGESYIEHVLNNLPEIEDEMPVGAIRRPRYFQRVGTPAHFERRVRERLSAS